MRNTVVVIASALLLAGCADSPLGPEVGTEEPLEAAGLVQARDLDVASYYLPANAWIKVAEIRTGVGVWIHTSNATRVVIGLGANRAREATYTGTSWIGTTLRLTLFRQIAQYFGANGYMGLEKNKELLKRVRNGQDVGLWILMEMTPHRYAPTNFRVLGAAQRPKGTSNPPWAWLWL